jgi:hypothetical protein
MVWWWYENKNEKGNVLRQVPDIHAFKVRTR